MLPRPRVVDLRELDAILKRHDAPLHPATWASHKAAERAKKTRRRTAAAAVAGLAGLAAVLLRAGGWAGAY